MLRFPLPKNVTGLFSRLIPHFGRGRIGVRRSQYVTGLFSRLITVFTLGTGALAADAATQWTGTFNPRPFGVAEAQALYERAI